MVKIILASKSKVRHEILKNNNINCIVEPSNINEEPIKESLIKNDATPEEISKNLAEIKANKVSEIKKDELVLGADSVIDLNGKIISKPSSREEAITMVLGLLLAPITKLARTANEVPGKLVRTLAALGEQKRAAS